VPLIKDSLVYPAIYDADRTLLSLPPIINGAATAVSSRTDGRAGQATETDGLMYTSSSRLWGGTFTHAHNRRAWY